MNAATVSVRPAVAADRPAILALAPRLAEGVAPWRSHQAAASAGRTWLDGSLDDALAGTGAVFVAVDGADLLGVISVHATTHFTGERDGYIGELVVAGAASRRGLGRALTSQHFGRADRLPIICGCPYRYIADTNWSQLMGSRILTCLAASERTTASPDHNEWSAASADHPPGQAARAGRPTADPGCHATLIRRLLIWSARRFGRR